MLDLENPINPEMDMQKNSYTRWFWRPRRPQEKFGKKCNLK